jgi:hypothetical protein
VAVVAALYLWYRKKITANNLLAGAALLSLLMGTAFSLLVPGGSCLFQWPLLLTLVALACRFLAADPEAMWVKLVAMVPTAVAAILLYGPAVYVLLTLAPISMHSALFGLFVLLLGLLTPHLEAIAGMGRWLLPGVGALGASWEFGGPFARAISPQEVQPSARARSLASNDSFHPWASPSADSSLSIASRSWRPRCQTWWA